MKRVISATQFYNIDNVGDTIKKLQARLARLKNSDNAYSADTVRKLRAVNDSVAQALALLSSI